MNWRSNLGPLLITGGVWLAIIIPAYWAMYGRAAAPDKTTSIPSATTPASPVVPAPRLAPNRNAGAPKRKQQPESHASPAPVNHGTPAAKPGKDGAEKAPGLKVKEVPADRGTTFTERWTEFAEKGAALPGAVRDTLLVEIEIRSPDYFGAIAETGGRLVACRCEEPKDAGELIEIFQDGHTKPISRTNVRWDRFTKREVKDVQLDAELRAAAAKVATAAPGRPVRVFVLKPQRLWLAEVARVVGLLKQAGGDENKTALIVAEYIRTAEDHFDLKIVKAVPQT